MSGLRRGLDEWAIVDMMARDGGRRMGEEEMVAIIRERMTADKGRQARGGGGGMSFGLTTVGVSVGSVVRLWVLDGSRESSARDIVRLGEE